MANILSKLLFLPILFLLSSCEFKEMQVSSLAKEYCSCVFVTKQSNSYCLDMATHLLHKVRIQSLDVRVDNETREVIASIGGEKASYEFVSERLGCLKSQK